MRVKTLSGVAIALLLGASTVAGAAGLGKLTVSSALGQVLSAEIDLLSLQPGEFEALTARVATPDAYKDAKIEYAASLRLLRFSVQRRANGQPYLKVSSDAPINEPFVDVLIELTWPSGRLLREYPILLDPPGFAQARSAAPVAAVAPAAAPSPEKPSTPPDSKTSTEAATSPASDGTYGPVRRGETLSGIAGQVKPQAVSLEQMLAALYRENQKAFIGNNMNRLKAGQILRIPSAEEAGKIEAGEARREIRAHVADWKSYREQMAGAVASQPAAAASPQQGAGSVTAAAVKAPPASAPASSDVLKLSKTDAAKSAPGGAVSQERLNALQEEIVARDKALKEAQSRVADLEKQVRDLQRLIDLKLGAPTKAPDAKLASAKPAEAKAPEAPKAGETVKGPEAPKATESKAPTEPPKSAEAPKPAPKPAAKPATKPAPPPPEPSMMDQIMENLPMVAGGLGVVGLLGFGGFMIARRRKASTEAPEPVASPSSAFPSDLKAGPTGGELVDTDSSSFLTDFDKTGPGSADSNEVDPVAEAEVYIAYGRDTQAEEILKEAMARDSNRHEIAFKLLEIYHARKSAAAFATVASGLHDAVGDASAIWHKAAAMGAQIDPTNPLYGGVSGGPAEPVAPAAKPDLDFDLGTSPGGGEAAPEAPSSLDFDLEAPAPGAAASEAETPKEKSDFDIDLSGLDFAAGEAAAPAAQAATDAKAPANMPDLDLSLSPAPAPSVPDSGSLDLADLNLESAPSEAASGPMATKLELAKAYIEIGDKDGAREILEEVSNTGSAAQKEEAQKLIASL